MSSGLAIRNAAYRLAVEAHEGQRYGDKPYTEHLSQVVDILNTTSSAAYPLRFAAIAAAWLHDALEDTALPADRIEAECGPVVLELVQAVTHAPGVPRRVWLPQLYERLSVAHPDARLIKVADRLANVRSCWETRDSRLFMYHREYKAFRAALHGDVRAAALWEELDGLLGFDQGQR